MNPEIERLFCDVRDRFQRSLSELPPPDGVVYACGFWLFYCDHTAIYPPCFAYNIVGNEKDAKWSPPEWTVDVVDRVYEPLRPIYDELMDLMVGQNHDAWESLIRYQWHIYSQLSVSITRNSRTWLKHWRLSDDFVCGIFEEREREDIYLALVRSSVGESEAVRLGILTEFQ